MLTKSRLMAVGMLAAVGVAGFAIGHATATWAGNRPARTGRARWSYSAMLQDSLQLTDLQRDSVHAILERHRNDMGRIFEAVRPRMDSMRTAVNDEVAAQMTPEQRERFAALRERWRVERAARGDSGFRQRAPRGRP